MRFEKKTKLREIVLLRLMQYKMEYLLGLSNLSYLERCVILALAYENEAKVEPKAIDLVDNPLLREFSPNSVYRAIRKLYGNKRIIKNNSGHLRVSDIF